MEKLIITVAPTGSVPRKKDTPYVPVTPHEIAETAYLCEQEGASIIHVHCRDENENPTSDYDVFKETVSKIRKRTHLLVMVSTSGVAGKSDDKRVEPLKTKPDMASLTTGSLNFAGRRPSIVYVNTWETITFLAKKMSEANIKPEIEAFDVGFIRQGIKLIEQGLVKEPAHFQLVMGVDGGIPASPENLLHMCHQLPEGSTFSVASVGRWQLSIIAMAIILGGHVRVGLEDNIYYRKGELTPNEDFVARVRRLAEELQREIATPKEVRKILGL
ncbi:MAG: 3-keto-5-aminohexanoate cleavage protein [Candidatus Bathyarchaeota archaeon]|nr:3-keto-5-aminohexanoate cleavage protein [Candidatus Bathyarchaeota archaeon]MDH5788186.1 3-keto-5-aminohexanoate cleavage protein [Candidatus Bathyarchaeota archaeon]